MRFTLCQGLCSGLSLVACFFPVAAAGQTPGSRASGMAGAFVAVADDATSIYWNPAGMATGALFSLVLDLGAGEASPADQDQADQRRSHFIGFTVPPLGLGYYRLHRVAASPAGTAEIGQPGRQEEGRSVQALTTSHVGVTLAQSLNRFVVVAGTFKYVRGEVVSGTVTGSPDEAIDAASGLPGRGTSRFDADAGVMLAVERWRLGLTARNLTTPAFNRPEPGAGEVELDREVRTGVAWGSGWPGLSTLVLSADVDLTRRPAIAGDRRDVAAGVETWWLGQRLGLRSGVRGSTVGAARPVVAGGVSAAVRSGVFVEAHVAGGDPGERSWSIGARVSF